MSRYIRVKLPERLKAKTVKTPGPLKDDCWVWTGGTWGRYGRLCYGGVVDYVHRHAYRHYHGEVPNGEMVLHRCDVPLCCNPRHLFSGTQKTNRLDARNKGRLPIKVTEEQVRKMRTMYAGGGWSYVRLGKQFGLSGPVTYRIVTGIYWSHIK